MPTSQQPFFLLDFQTGRIIRAPEFCEPKASSFKKAKKWSVNIEGTDIEFRTPKHNSIVYAEKAKYPDSKYNYEVIPFRDTYNKNLHIKDLWKNACLYFSRWSLNGPLLTGSLADISSSFFIMKHKTTNENISFFHPRVFEKTVSDFITNGYSKHKDEGQHEYIAPVDWEAYNSSNTPAARFKIITNESIKPFHQTEFFFFVLDDNHLAYFVFHPSRHVFHARTKADYDKKIGEKYINELIDNVINSINITLSDKAKSQQKKAIEGLADSSVTTSFPPLKWDRDNETFNNTQQKITAE